MNPFGVFHALDVMPPSSLDLTMLDVQLTYRLATSTLHDVVCSYSFFSFSIEFLNYKSLNLFVPFGFSVGFKWTSTMNRCRCSPWRRVYSLLTFLNLGLLFLRGRKFDLFVWNFFLPLYICLNFFCSTNFQYCFQICMTLH